jgi:peptidyl-prolyl cis-trans isomerase A (cyclophilin A)
VVIVTSLGDITVELTPQKTPLTVKNFLRYVDEKHFDNTVFHRVIQGFMIQGGGFSIEGKQKETHSPIRNESKSGLSNQRGTIAMARTNNPDSATSQFFINLADNKRLDSYGGGYTAFGKVAKGMDVVDKIAAVSVRVGPLTAPEPAQPVEPVTIKSIRRTSTD